LQGFTITSIKIARYSLAIQCITTTINIANFTRIITVLYNHDN